VLFDLHQQLGVEKGILPELFLFFPIGLTARLPSEEVDEVVMHPEERLVVVVSVWGSWVVW
jgi:hypothetical protein